MSAIANLSSGVYSNYNQLSSLNYPAPWMNFERHLVPDSMKKVCEMLAHHFLNNSTINSVIESTAGYPLTTFSFIDDISEEYKDKWREIIEVVDLKSHDFKLGIDYFLYGNAATSVYEPFDRWMTCSKCSNEYNTNGALPIKWMWKGNDFKIHCPKCKTIQPVSNVQDKKITNPSKAIKGINLVRWNIFDLETEEHPYSANKKWVHVVPNKYINKFIDGRDQQFIAETPIKIIKAIREKLKGKTPKARIVFDKDEMQTIQRPMPSMPKGELSGWGLPLGISALRDIFFHNTITRAQAVILQENIVPFRIISPTTPPGYEALDVDNQEFKTKFEAEFAAWKLNPQHAMVSAVIPQITQLGGDSKALNMFAEKQIVNQDITRSLNTSKALIEGDMTYSGGSVALRMFENSLMTYIEKIHKINNWTIQKISDILRIKPIKVRYVAFKMGEDPQNKSLLDGLNQRGLLSNEDLLQQFGFDADEQHKKVQKEKERQVKADAKFSAIGQIKANKMLEYSQINEPTALANGGMPIDPNQVSMIDAQLRQADPVQKQQVMQQMQQQDPYLAKTLSNRMDLSPDAAINMMMDLQQTPPDIAQQRMNDLATSDPIKTKIMQIMSEVLPGMPMPQQEQKPKPLTRLNFTPLPKQRPPMRVGGI